MKILDDLSVFTCRKAKLLYADPPSMISNAGRHRSIRECVCCHPPLLKQPLYCRYVSRSVLDDYFFQRRLRQKFLSLEYVFEGSIHVRSGEEAWLLEAGDLLLMHPGRRSGLLHLPGSTCRKSGMILGGGRLEETLRLLNLENARCLHFPDSGRMENFIARLCRALHAVRAPGGCERVSGIVFELLSGIANSDASRRIPSGILRIREHLERNLAEKMNMNRLAAEFGMSLPTFNRRFREAFRMTPCRYLMEQRILLARRLLTESPMRVKEVAEKTGFQNQLYFSAAFRKACGMSPEAWRRHAVRG